MKSPRDLAEDFDLPRNGTVAGSRSLSDAWSMPPEPWDIAGIRDRGDLACSWVDTFRSAKLIAGDLKP